MNIEEKYNELKEEIEKLRENLDTLTRENIYKKGIYDGTQTRVFKNSGILSELKDKQYRLRKHKISIIDGWSMVFKLVSAIAIFILIYPSSLTTMTKLIETATKNLVMQALLGYSVLLTGSVVLSFKIINTVAKKKIEKIKDTPEYKKIEEEIKANEKAYEDSLKLLEAAKEEYQDAKIEYEKQNKLLSEKELILSWFKKAMINNNELIQEEKQTTEKPHTKVREIK